MVERIRGRVIVDSLETNSQSRTSDTDRKLAQGVVYTGSIAPSDSDGTDNSIYLRTNGSGEVYFYAGGRWSLLGTLTTG